MGILRGPLSGATTSPTETRWNRDVKGGVDPDHLLDPVEVAGKQRLLVVVAHPTIRGGTVPLGRHPEQDQMEL